MMMMMMMNDNDNINNNNNNNNKKTRRTWTPQTSAEAADPIKFLQLSLSRSAKNSVKIPGSADRYPYHDISTKIEWLLLVRHLTHPKKIIRIRRQLF